MKEILDILMKAPIKQLAAIDPKLAGLVVKKSGVYAKPKGTKRFARGENDILYYYSDLAYGQRRLLGWTHERMVNEGEAEWVKPNPRSELFTFFGDADTFALMMSKGWTHDQLVAEGYAMWGKFNE